MKISFFILSLLIVSKDCVVFGSNENFDKIDDTYQEGPCSRVGGMCVVASDCPSGRLTQESGLCPAQQTNGIECCYGRSVKDTRCKTMGICRPMSEFCNPRLIIPATDCPENTRCCVLV